MTVRVIQGRPGLEQSELKPMSDILVVGEELAAGISSLDM